MHQSAAVIRLERQQKTFNVGVMPHSHAVRTNTH